MTSILKTVVRRFATQRQVFGISIKSKDRAAVAPDVQSLLTAYGDIIHCRFGLNEGKQSPLIVLAVQADAKIIQSFEKDLKLLGKSIQVKKMKFD
eukprot:TRINITY_DN1460_c0_g1_i1.p1 TRINITY_DN1460_c0_g1~~TRINITY_DN1460_c0_g1_i1.p1  ORF type:complete len:102 (-),score=24.48 TRINITY_DN1460_c0_g1_i1:413-697(-)